MATHRATARICLDLEVEDGIKPEAVLVEELGDFLKSHSIVELFNIKPFQEVAESSADDGYGYEDALSHLEGLGDLREDGIFTDDDQLALDKGKQAIRDCLEIGLNGIGE